jgi:hypothetical protein
VLKHGENFDFIIFLLFISVSLFNVSIAEIINAKNAKWKLPRTKLGERVSVERIEQWGDNGTGHTDCFGDISIK